MTRQSGDLLNRITTVLFDLDGTLLDTAPDLVAALLAVCAEEHQPAPDPALAACYVSRGAIGLVSFAFPQRDAATLERLRARLVAIYQGNLCSRTQPYPGITAALAALTERGLQWGIVTNKLRFLAE
ncbi:MAG: HAD hydrolase-like protein, partial [Gammaproteobacteria bacterium]|nr:HAD hydrolase-like protein [Gammaproteobacteria bacterium]